MAEYDIDLLESWRVLWARKWRIAAVTGATAVLSIVYVLSATEWYRAEVVLIPSDYSESSLSGLGGLAGLATMDLLGNRGNSTAIAVLRSRELARSFIEDEALLPVLFADGWDENANSWLGGPDNTPDLLDGVKYFQKNVLSTREDSASGLVYVTVDWKDPDTAARWANAYVGRLNAYMRKAALEESEANVEHLKDQLADTTLISLQQSISRLLESELHQIMLAHGRKEYAYRVVDRAQPPKERLRPRRSLTVALATALAAFLSAFVVLFAEAVRERP